MADRIVVIGGGFAGFWAVLAARRVAGDRIDVTLVSRDPYLQMRPRLYEAHPETLALDLRPLLGEVGVQFWQGEASLLDDQHRSVVLAGGESLDYDRLVVATGSVMRRPPVPGAERAFSIDTVAEAVAFDERLGEIVANSANPSVAIVGAGFTGIELATELRDRVAIHGGAEIGESLNITLFDRASVVGAELGEGPRPAIEAALAQARVETVLGVTIAELSADRIRLDDGTDRDFDAVVLATGMVASPFVAQVPGERDRLGRIIVDASLRTPAAPEIFVTGDAAAAEVGDGHRALQSCQHALQLGRFAGENAARDLLGLPVVPYTQPRYVTCLDLGRWGAVFTRGWDRVVEDERATAKERKRNINTVVIYPPAGASRQELLRLSSLDPAEQRLRVS
jgi:NADH dehydrogenase